MSKEKSRRRWKHMEVGADMRFVRWLDQMRQHRGPPREVWTEWLQRWLPRGISAVLLALVALVIWNGVLDWRTTQAIATVPVMRVPRMPPVVASAVVKSGDAVDRLVASHLFGNAAVRAELSAVPPSQDWNVIGIVAAADPKTSIADISINGDERLWHVGDRLPDGSTVAAIASDSVTLNRNGEVLLLTFALRPAAMDARYPTIALTKTVSGKVTQNLAANQASSTTVRSAAKSLATLRAAALRVWTARSRHPPTH